jgi:hypothetical protein
MKNFAILMKIFILLTFFAIPVTLAQTTISGKVTSEDEEPLPSANVFLKDTYDGISTDAKGNYSFNTFEEGERTLVASYIGYKSGEQKVTLNGGELVVDFVLEEEASELDQVVISAGSFEASDEKKSVILRPLDVVSTAGAEADVYAVLQTLPGTQTIGETEGLFVRGGSAAESKTIIDGMVVQNPYYSSVPDIPSRGRFSPFIFKGTIFSTGGYSAQYGQALSSALILNSQDLARETQSSINIMALALGASHTQRWENTSLSGEFSYYNLGPYFEIQKQRTDWIKPPIGIDGSVVFRQKTSQTGLLKLYSTYSRGNLSLNVDNLDNPAGKDRFQMKDYNYYLNTSYSEILGDDWTFFAGFSYSKDNRDINLADDLIGSDEQLLQSRVTISKSLFGSSSVTFGGEVHNLRVDESFNNFNRKLNSNFFAGYAETDLFITKNLAARLGLRLEKDNAIDKTNLAPRTALAYQVGEGSTFNFAYGHFYQTPEKDFLYADSPLSFEKAVHYILNYQYIDQFYTFRIEGYYKEYDDLTKQITFPDDMTEYPVYNNSGSGYAKGIDIFWRDKKSINLSDYWISYSYLDTKRDYRDFPTLAQPTFATPHTLSIVFKRWVPEITTYLGFTYSFATGRPYYNPNNPVFNGDKTRSYNNLSFNASHLVNLFDNFTVVYFSVTNVLGFSNVFGYRYSSDGSYREGIVPAALRSAFLGVFISLGENNPY